MPPGIFIGISIVKINPVVNEMEDGKYNDIDDTKFWDACHFEIIEP